jgi:hypothetical protein
MKNGKMRPVETIPGMGEKGKEEIWNKNFYKYHNGPPVQQ